MISDIGSLPGCFTFCLPT